MTKPKALLIDITKCIGCQLCALACKEANGLPGEEEEELSATAYTVVKEKDDVYYRRLCMHCNDPSCKSVCPVGAFEKTPQGAVIYHAHKCIGCRYCMQACPFSVPTYEWKKIAPKVQKCNMCYERQKEGKITACAEACPTGATIFGDREELIKEARKRIKENPELYVNHIYGEHEVGGTSVLMLSNIAFEKLGFPNNLPNDPLPLLTWKALKTVPSIAIFGGAFLYGVWWIIDRRMELVEYKTKERESKKSQEKI
ncbi:MAG: 4Fe-4S dicluster domain-containing protein [candidate division Zixibacteria bacterium]|nr:4Fe-4S dicluster domain-containing protein [candidate division Zixibacteria bacterium]